MYHSGALLIKFKDLPTTSPIPGEVLEVVVSEGQQVAAGEILMNVECYKDKVRKHLIIFWLIKSLVSLLFSMRY